MRFMNLKQTGLCLLGMAVFAITCDRNGRAQTTSTTIQPSLIQLNATVVPPGGGVTANVTYTVQGTEPVAYQRVVLTARQPQTTNAGGPFYDFTPSLTAGTFVPGQTISLQSSYSLPLDAVTGTWRVYVTWEDTSNVWHDGPSVTLNVMNNDVLRGVNSYDFLYSSGYGDGYGPALSSDATYPYLYSRGIRLIRLPFSHGDTPSGGAGTGIQPMLLGDLDPNVLSRLKTEVAKAAAAGLQVVLDLHCSIRFPCSYEDDAGQTPGEELTQDQFNDVWLKISREFRGLPGVYAYDLANEPFQDANETAQQQNAFVMAREQGAVAALRADGDNTRVIIEGSNYDSPTWVAARSPWISDPAGNVEYSGHDYPGTGGGSIVFNQAAADAFVSDIQTFESWCNGNQVRCYIGEWGWPGANSMPDGDTDWQLFNATAEQAYEAADAANMDVTYFTSETSYNNSLAAYSATTQGLDLNGQPMICRPMSVAQTQSQVIEAHPTYAVSPETIQAKKAADQ
jgi:endoglucanase